MIHTFKITTTAYNGGFIVQPNQVAYLRTSPFTTNSVTAIESSYGNYTFNVPVTDYYKLYNGLVSSAVTENIAFNASVSGRLLFGDDFNAKNLTGTISNLQTQIDNLPTIGSVTSIETFYISAGFTGSNTAFNTYSNLDDCFDYIVNNSLDCNIIVYPGTYSINGVYYFDSLNFTLNLNPYTKLEFNTSNALQFFNCNVNILGKGTLFSDNEISSCIAINGDDNTYNNYLEFADVYQYSGSNLLYITGQSSTNMKIAKLYNGSIDSPIIAFESINNSRINTDIDYFEIIGGRGVYIDTNVNNTISFNIKKTYVECGNISESPIFRITMQLENNILNFNSNDFYYYNQHDNKNYPFKIDIDSCLSANLNFKFSNFVLDTVNSLENSLNFYNLDATNLVRISDSYFRNNNLGTIINLDTIDNYTFSVKNTVIKTSSSACISAVNITNPRVGIYGVYSNQASNNISEMGSSIIVNSDIF